MTQSNDHPFHPKRWTALTWLAILLWSWFAFQLNDPPTGHFTLDPVSGKLSDPIRYKSLSEIPFSVGWPLHYVIPSNSPTLQPVVPVGAPMPLPLLAPSSVSPFAMVGDLMFVVLSIAALVYLLQRFLIRFSLSTLFLSAFAIALFYPSGKLVRTIAGVDAARWYFIAVYFSPIPAALAVRYSVHLRFDWENSRLNWKRHQPSFDDYDSPDDALAAASRLNMLGDWDASINLYRHTAQRWPEHTEYIQHCIDQVTEKQSLAQV